MADLDTDFDGKYWVRVMRGVLLSLACALCERPASGPPACSAEHTIAWSSCALQTAGLAPHEAPAPLLFSLSCSCVATVPVVRFVRWQRCPRVQRACAWQLYARVGFTQA